jgi:hypothetical protein
LLADSRSFSATYANGMANHLSMALVALDRLGASDDRLREFAAMYQQRLRAKAEAEAKQTAKFAAELQEKGRDAFLRDVVSPLTPGLASEAFHGLIRTAYAVDSGDDTDLPDAITSWVLGFEEVGRFEEKRWDTAIDAFMAMNRDDRFPKDLAGRSITGRIRKIIAIPAFDDYRFGITNLELRDLAKIAALLFLATSDFTVLHLVTACHATRVLQSYLAADAVDHLGVAMLAAYASIGRPDFDVDLQPPRDLPDWPSLAARAIPSDDEHDLKLVYSCQQEETMYGWGLHHMAASSRLGAWKVGAREGSGL